MSSSTPTPLTDRTIGCRAGADGGPTLVIFGGLHGNEPGGVAACRRVLSRLETEGIPLRGRLEAYLGNRPALAAGQRYLDRDLNRCWDDESIRRLHRRDPDLDSAEDREQRELLKLIRRLHNTATSPIVFIDLHTTSGHGPPFCAMADTVRNRSVAFALPIPIILGLEETLEGALLGWLSDLGHIGIVIEGGRHTDADTPALLESALWICLVAAGSISEGDLPDLPLHRRRLAEAAKGAPPVVEIRYRHAITPRDQFKMLPGFTSFQPITEGQELARDRQGPVTAREGGFLLMPLYQAQGSDGFFISRAVNRSWLGISAWLRRVQADRLLPLLPGVQRDPGHPDRLLISPSVRLLHPIDVFHLFGYRRRADRGDHLVFSRRRQDHQPLLAPAELNPPPPRQVEDPSP